MIILFNFLIFPGFLFSASIGLLSCWVDRKVTARLQWRIGPPWHQNFTDLIKLFGKETIVPEGAKFTFLLAPYLGFLSLILVATILGQAIFLPKQSFSADLIVILYLLVIPAISLIIGASSSRNPLASIGASREMKLVLSYELPFILAIIAMIIKSGGRIRLAEILAQQQISGSNIFSWAGFAALAAMIFCAMGKIGLGPFEVSEAEQEIMAGTLIEYSGWPLAIFKLNKALLFYIMPMFCLLLFIGRDLSLWLLVLKYIAILVVFILIKNTNPRLRIDQVMRFFWGPVTVITLSAIVLAILGK